MVTPESRPDQEPQGARFYKPIRDSVTAISKMESFLSSPKGITSADIFESIADAFAVKSGTNYERYLQDAEETYAIHPRFGEVDFSYYRYRESGPDEEDRIEDALIQLGSDKPCITFYRHTDGRVSATKLVSETGDEEPLELKIEDKREIIEALIFCVQPEAIPNNP